jgi:aspartate-semialdehyde dehydrogenase
VRKLKVAVVGAESLIGKELRAVLLERNLPAGSIKLIDEQEVVDVFTEFEVATSPGVTGGLFDDVELVFICGKSHDTERYLPWLKSKGITAIDLSSYLNREKDIPLVISGVNEEKAKKHRGLIALPHPLTIIIASLLKPLIKRYRLLEVIVNAFQPASEYGACGLEELYQQTVKVLNFAELPKKVFGRQLAFNIFPAISPSELGGATEENIIKEVGIVLEDNLPISLRLIQAAVFHSFAISFFLVIEEEPTSSELMKTLAGASGIRLAKGREKDSGPVEAAGKNEIIVGKIKKDKRRSSAYWIWATADNLRRGSAINAVEIAELITRGD